MPGTGVLSCSCRAQILLESVCPDDGGKEIVGLLWGDLKWQQETSSGRAHHGGTSTSTVPIPDEVREDRRLK